MADYAYFTMLMWFLGGLFALFSISAFVLLAFGVIFLLTTVYSAAVVAVYLIAKRYQTKKEN